MKIIARIVWSWGQKPEPQKTRNPCTRHSLEITLYSDETENGLPAASGADVITRRIDFYIDE